MDKDGQVLLILGEVKGKLDQIGKSVDHIVRSHDALSGVVEKQTREIAVVQMQVMDNAADVAATAKRITVLENTASRFAGAVLLISGAIGLFGRDILSLLIK